MTETQTAARQKFLLARIGEDEQSATRHRAAADACGLGAYPARVLAECTAKRALIAYAEPHDDMGDLLLRAFADPSVNSADLAQAEPFARVTQGLIDRALGDVLKYLALPYASHPDYRPEWRRLTSD